MIIRKLIRDFLSLVDPNGDFVFLLNRRVGRIRVPSNSMSGDSLSDFLAENSLGKKVLEFGSGGSTLIFAKRASKVVSVESDRYFANSVAGILRKQGISNATDILWVNIGPTKSYGQPWSTLKYLMLYRYQNYSDEVFKKYPGVNLSDVVFVDGRFRVACAMNSILCIKHDFILIIDDYFDRSEYFVIDSVLGQPNISLLNTAIFYVEKEKVSLKLVERVYLDYRNDPR